MGLKFYWIGFIILLIITNLNFSQQDMSAVDSNLAYYPNQIGNKWVFNETIIWEDPPNIILRIWSQEIIDDTLMPNNENYRVIKRNYSDNNPPLTYSFERIDTTEQKIFSYDSDSDTTNYEILILDLSIELFDTFYNPYCIAIFGEAGTVSKFGHIFSYRSYYWECGFIYSEFHYLENLGQFRQYYHVDFIQSSSNLKGCLVDGILYGDTTTVSVDENPSIARTFELNQNYPNPFNSSTKIKYRIAEFGFVSLIIYDVLGNETATLVNEEKPAGEYEIEFDGTGLTSGIYFYKLQSGEYNQTRKMILLK